MAWTIGAQPINWINDDFRDLGASTTLGQVISGLRWIDAVLSENAG